MNPALIALLLVVGTGTGYGYVRTYKRSHDDYEPDDRVRFLKPFTFGVAALALAVVGTLIPAVAALLPANVATALHAWLVGFGVTVVVMAYSEWRDRNRNTLEEYVYV